MSALDDTTPRDELRATLRETARDLLSARIGSAGRHALRESAVPGPALWREVAELGWLSAELSEQDGGLGLGFEETAILLEEAGRQAASLPLMAATLGIGAVLAADFAVRETWLSDLADGSMIATVALDSRLQATAEDGGWRLRGEAGHVLDLPQADVVVVVTQRDDGVPLIAIVAADDPGVTISAQPTIDLSRNFGRLFVDVLVPASRILAEPERSAQLAAAITGRGAVALAADSLGGADAVLELTLDYLRERHQFGRAIGSFQAIKHRCADLYLAVEASRCAVEHAAAQQLSRDPFAASIAKAHATETYLLVCEEAIQLHGGIGITWEHDLHLYLKRALLNRALAGSIEVHRDRVAAAVLARGGWS